MFKKSVSLILCICVIFSALTLSASAAQKGEITDNLTWELSTLGRLSIEGDGTAIPDYAEGGAPWAEDAGRVTALSLPQSLISIGDYAFSGCANLKKITLSNKITRIGKGAFKDCGITELSLPYSLEAVEAECFMGCEELETITFNEQSSGGLDVLVKEGLKSIGDNAFEFCYSLKKLSFPSTLEVIGNEAFAECDSISSVSFADKGAALKSIGEGAFTYCTSLTSFTIPANITEIGTETFSGTGLKTISLPAKIAKIGYNAFAFCEDLARIDILGADCEIDLSDETTPDTARLYVIGSAAKVISYAQKFSKPITVLCVGRTSSHAKFKTTVSKASAKTAGKISEVCPSCGYTKTTVIAKVKTVKLTKASFVYNAKKQFPSASQVQITDEKGNIIAPSNYTVTCGTAGKAVGKHSVKIAFKASSNYSGSFVRYYTIVPKGTAIKAAVAGKGTLKVSWTKQAVQTTGYQIRLCKKANFSSGVKTITIKNNKTLSYTVKGLARKTGYYIQIRTFKTVSGTHYFSAWSKSFGRKTK